MTRCMRPSPTRRWPASRCWSESRRRRCSTAKGTTVEIGRGVIDTPKLIRTLVRLKYTGTLHFEHEKDEKDPFPGLAESVGYVRGLMAAV